MSMCYWIIQGVGICADEIEEFINKEKLANKLLEQLPDDDELLSMVETKNYSKLDIDDFLFGCPFDNIAEVLWHCDDTDSLTYSDDGEGESYLYYPPSMPWHHTDTEPKSVEEVHKRIIDAVKKITTLSDEEISKMIDDELYIVGCG